MEERKYGRRPAKKRKQRLKGNEMRGRRKEAVKVHLPICNLPVKTEWIRRTIRTISSTVVVIT